MQETLSSKLVVTEICDPNKSRALHHRNIERKNKTTKQIEISMTILLRNNKPFFAVTNFSIKISLFRNEC